MLIALFADAVPKVKDETRAKVNWANDMKTRRGFFLLFLYHLQVHVV